MAEKQRQLTAVLGALKTARDRLGYIVGRGRSAPPLETQFKTEAYRVVACRWRILRPRSNPTFCVFSP